MLKCLEHESNRQVFADLLNELAYRPVRSENTQSTWVYGIVYVFRTIKGPKVNVYISKQRGVL